MKKLFIILFALLLTGAATGQTSKHAPRAKRPAAATSGEAPLTDEEEGNQLRKRLTDILNAWSLMDADQIAKYYSKSADLVFFELTPPLQEKGFDQYYLAIKKFFDQYTDLNLRLNDDAAVHFKGDLAYATATWDMLGTLKDGTKQHLALRWTVVLERQNGDWLVVHEHVSAPMAVAAPEPPKTLPPPQPEKPKDPFK